MTSWADVASKALDFMLRPSGLTVFLILMGFLFIIYVAPLLIVTDNARVNTDRIVAAIREHCTNHTRTDTVRISEKR